MSINFLENSDEEVFFERSGFKAICILLIGVCCICFVLVVSSDSWKRQNAVENFKEYSVAERVKEKALETTGRNYPYLLIGNRREYVVELVWDCVAVGDSVYKTKNTKDFRIIKTDTVITITANTYKIYLDSIYSQH